MPVVFTVTKDHLKLARRMYVTWIDGFSGLFGAPAVDPKRPYGTTNVYRSMGEILGIEPDEEDEEGPQFSEDQRVHMAKLHEEMMTVIQIALATGGFRLGLHSMRDRYDDVSWEKGDVSLKKKRKPKNA